jgi:WD40 repeat protein
MTMNLTLILRLFAFGLVLITNLEFRATVRAQEKSRIEIGVGISHVGSIDKAAFSPDGARLVSAGDDGTMKVWEVATGRLIHTLEGHRGQVAAIAFSRDGSRILSASHEGLKLWDASSGQYIRGFERKLTTFTAVAFSPDGTSILSGDRDGVARMWDIATGQVIQTFQHGEKLSDLQTVAFSSDGARVLTGGGSRADKVAKLWDARSGQLLQAFGEPKPALSRIKLTFSADNTRVLVADGQSLTVWEAATGKMLHALEGREFRGIDFVGLSQDGGRMFAGGYGWTGIWNAKTGRRVNSFEPADEKSRFIAMSPDGARAVSGDKILTLWDLSTGEPVRDLVGLAHPVTAVGVSPDGTRVLAGSLGGMTGLWDTRSGKIVSATQLQGSFRSVNGILGVAVGPNGNKAVAPMQVKYGVWNTETGEVLHSVRAISAGDVAALSADGRFMAGPGEREYSPRDPMASDLSVKNIVKSEGNIHLWDTATGEVVLKIDAGPQSMSSVALSANGSRMAWGSRAGTVYVADTGHGGRIVRTFDIQSEYKLVNNITAVALSPDNSYVLAAGYEAAVKTLGNKGAGIKLWDITTGQLVRSWDGPAKPNSLVFLPDGKRAISAGEEASFSLWDVTTGKLIRNFEGHAAQVTSLGVSRDGRRIYSGGRDGTTRMWDTDSGALLASLILREQGRWLAVTPEGFFDAPAADAGNGVLSVVHGLDSSSADKLLLTLYRPDLVREKLSGDPGGKVKKAAAGLDFSAVLGSKPETTGALTPQPSVAATVEMVTQIGHYGAAGALAFSRDGRFVATGSSDKTVKLWDVATGYELRTFTGHHGTVDAVAFSPDGRTILSGGDDNALKVWNVFSGAELRTFAGHRGTVKSIVFSENGRLALSGGWDNTMKLWDVPSGKQLRSFEGHRGSVDSVALSHDRRFALSASADNTARIWDVSTGNVLQTLTHGDAVLAVAISPDGRFALTGSKDKTMKLWDVATGKEIRSFAHENTVSSVAFSIDGKMAVAGTGYERLLNPQGQVSISTPDTIQLWDVATGSRIRTFGDRRDPIPNVNGRIGLLTSAVLSPDGRTVLSNSGGPVRLWDAATGKMVQVFEGNSYKVRSVLFSPDGRQGLASIGGTLRLWDVPTGKELRRFGKTRWGIATAFSPDGRFILSGTHGGFEQRMMDNPGGRALAFSPDGRFALSAGGWLISLLDAATGAELRSFGSAERDADTIVRLWDLSTGKEVRSFTGHSKRVTSVAFSPDGRLALSGGWDKSVILWDVATGRQLRSVQAAHYAANFLHQGVAVAFSPDGSRAYSASANALEIWDVANGKLLGRIPINTLTIAFSRDGRMAATTDEEKGLVLWDLTTGKEVRSLAGHKSDVSSLAFSPDGRQLLSGGDDGTARIWKIVSGRELARTLTGAYGEWLALTPEGFFSSKYRDTGMLAIVRGLEVTTIGQIHQSLFNPDLVREALTGDTAGEVKRASEFVSLPKVLESGPPPKVAIVSPQLGSRSASDLVNVTARVTDGGKGVGRIEWRVNNVTASVMGVPDDAGPTYEVKRTLALDPGENRIEVIAYEKRNILASLPARAAITYEGPVNRAKPTLHILAVGINAYQDEGWVPPGSTERIFFPKLNLAVADAKTFGAQMQKAGNGLYGEVRVIEALDNAATAANLDRLFAQISEQINPRDTFVMFAAAHGISEDGRFYLIPQDYQGGNDPKALAENAIGQERLQDWVANRIKARKAIILLDTCESGALVSGYTKSRTDAPASEAAIGRLHEATGRPVLTAAASGKPAFEGYKGHGVFTFALIEALRRSDTSGNGTIELSELVAHVQTLVPKLSAELSGPTSEKGVALVAMRGLKDDKQSAHFGSTGEDFALVRTLP